MSSPTAAHVFLHIGTMKTGTSYIQQVLERNPTALEADGAIYAFSADGTRGAVQEALRSRDELSTTGRWARVVEVAHAHTGERVIISNELLSFAGDARAQQIVDSLRPNPVTVIITARDLVRLLPSAWQNKVKHGRGWSFTSYVDSVIDNNDDPKGAARSFWHHHDLAKIVRRWVGVVGVENVVVVAVPGPDAGPDALWERFTTVVGLSRTGYNLSRDRKSNLSLGYVETELLRLVSRRLRGEPDWSRHKKVIQRVLANQVLRPDPTRPAVNARPQLTPAQHAWAITRSRELVDAVTAEGVTLEGAPDELVPRPMTEDEEQVALASVPPEIPEMYVEVVAALIARVENVRGGPTIGERKSDAELDAEDDDDEDELELDDDVSGPVVPRDRAGRGGRRREERAGRPESDDDKAARQARRARRRSR